MQKHYCFAGVELTVDIPDNVMYDGERHLASFRVDSVKEPHRFVVETVDSLAPPVGTLAGNPPGMRIYREGEQETRYVGIVTDSWENAYLQVDSLGKNHFVKCLKSKLPGRIHEKTVLNCLGTEHLIARAGGFVFHCAYIEAEGGAILFTAPSGTGKSTQAELWRSLRNSQIINGDRAAVRAADSRLTAEGIPFAGSSQYCENRSLPIRAIVYLAQAQETSIRRLRGYEAFSRIWEGVSVNTWDPVDMEMVSDAVLAAARQVPVFHMPCTPDESAVIALEEALRKLE